MAKKVEKKDVAPDQDPPSEAFLEDENTDDALEERDDSEAMRDEIQDASTGSRMKAAADAYGKIQDEADYEEGVGEDADMHPAADAVADLPVDEGTEAAKFKAIAQRTAAEFDNYRKRVRREQAQWRRDILGDFLKEFLPAFDDLDRAIAEGEKGHDFETIHDGAKMVRNNLWKSLDKAGIVEIDAHGKKFDPVYHEAMTAIPVPDTEPNTVVEVFQRGYMIDDFVLRPAKVVVSAAG